MFEKTNSTVSKNNEEKETLCYIEADKPLVYNFFDVTSLSQLTDKEPTSGKRKVNKKKDSSEEKGEKGDGSDKKNIDDDELKLKKLKNESNEIYEGNLRDEINDNKNKKFDMTKNQQRNKEDKSKEEKKIKLKFKKYTNAFNVSNNKLTSLNGIYEVLTELLPELTFKSKLGKVELLQWIDVSRNKLTDISADITRLPYLKILYVHGNNIQEIEKVTNLAKCPSLTSLTLYGNPIDHIRGYRHFIIEMCQLLEKLDGAVVSEKELDIIKFRGSRYGEVRNKKGVVTRYPKLPEEIIKTIQMAEQNNGDKKDEN
jgi:Leucine-rich repeat (LRR) protein